MNGILQLINIKIATSRAHLNSKPQIHFFIKLLLQTGAIIS